MIKEGIGRLVEGRELTPAEAELTMNEIMSGSATDAQIAAFLTALRMKGETIDEVTAFATVMRRFCRRIHPKVSGRLVDTCGTGGDLIKTFNVSTTSAFVAAGAGVAVAKHGNRSVTSRCGSADVLETLGLDLKTDPQVVERAIEQVGIGFMFAPNFHPAMKHAIGPRREVGIRTVFNLLGPLTNPANADAQLIGVYDHSMTEPIAHVLRNLGSREAMVVHGLDGLDEISTIGKTRITWLKDGDISSKELNPEDLGLRRGAPELLEGSDPHESAKITFNILCGSGGDSSKRDMVLANSAAAIIIGGKAEDFTEAVSLAESSIDTGSAYEKLRSLIRLCGDISKLEEFESHG